MRSRLLGALALVFLSCPLPYTLGAGAQDRPGGATPNQAPAAPAKLALPSKKQLALIVHDMTNDGLKPGGKYVQLSGVPAGTQEVIANNARLLEAARRHRLTVFHTGHFLRDDGFDATHRSRAAKIGALRAGTWGAEFVDELKPAPGETIIRKGGGYSAFTGTALEKWLRRRGITTIIIGGVATNSGVEATVRAALDLDFESVVVSDACNASPAHHQASLLNMGQFATIATTSDVITALDKASD
jgi:nicotinamidase-related amidase